MWHLLVAAALALPPAAAPAYMAPRASDIVVSADWLRAHLGDRDLVVLDLTMPAMGDSAYARGHIPGARALDFHTLYAGDGKDGALTMQMLPADSLRHVLEGLGVTDASTIVLYGPSQWMSAVARAFVTLDYVGLGERTHILDGGYDAWTQAGGPTETATPSYGSSALHVAPHRGVIAERDYVTSHLTDPSVTIVDARAPEFYDGSTKGHYATRQGHVPGAHNVYFATLADSVAHRYLTPAAARARFAAAGVPLDRPVVVYCHIGQTASVDYVQLRRLGVPVRLYDGSFEDWSRTTALPITVGNTP